MSSSLFRRAWQPHNREALLSFVRRGRSEHATAALDWDNTCIFGDVGSTCFRYLLRHGSATRSMQQMADLLPTRMTGRTSDVAGASLLHLSDDILESYRALLALNAQQVTGKKRARSHVAAGAFCHVEHPSVAQKDFSCRVLALYEALLNMPGVDHAEVYASQVRFFAGFTPHAIKTITAGALAQAQETEATTTTWKSHERGASGISAVRFDPRVRALPEMQELISLLTTFGILPHIVSASFEPLVEGCAKILGYAVPAVHIYGMRLAQETPSSVYLPKAKKDWPLTYRAGKVTCIRQNLLEPPSFVAGDHITDYEMLTNFPETKIRLIIDRKSKLSEMRALYALARKSNLKQLNNASDKVITLLQRRNETLACFASL